MTHDKHQEQISQLLDNDLPEQESPPLFAHCVSCHECRVFMQLSLRLRSGLAADSMNVRVALDGKLRRRYSPTIASKSASVQSLWNRHVTLGFPVVAFVLCLIAVGAVLVLLGRSPFHDHETVYVTRLPAIVITDEMDGVQPVN